jgi:endonuclease/exonuclease/phosphatase (EEP) superfamily protein YafD
MPGAFLLLLALCAQPVAAAVATTDTLTVVTLNLWHDQRDWPKRLSAILAEMRRIRPDVLCLQEVLQHPELRNQAETSATAPLPRAVRVGGCPERQSMAMRSWPWQCWRSGPTSSRRRPSQWRTCA